MGKQEENSVEPLVMNEELVRSIEKALPAPPHIVMEILRIVQNPNINFDALTKVLQRDPSFIAKVFKYASKVAVEAGKGPVDSIKRAVELLGMEKLRRIALTVSLVTVMEVRRVSDYDVESFWRESFATGVASEILCQIGDTWGRTIARLGLWSRICTRYRKICRIQFEAITIMRD